MTSEQRLQFFRQDISRQLGKFNNTRKDHLTQSQSILIDTVVIGQQPMKRLSETGLGKAADNVFGHALAENGQWTKEKTLWRRLQYTNKTVKELVY